jgi:glyoxylase-like metal-dependent hydrolase (beta-lactamase superfamily II)
MRRTAAIRLLGLSALLACAWAAYTQAPAQPAMVLHKIADDLFVIDGGGAGNVAVYTTDEGVILVDDKFDTSFDEIMANVKKVSSLPVRYVINTHYHSDHSGGNTRFAPTGAQIISTALGRKHIVGKTASNAPANMVPANITFDNQMSVFLGGKEVRAMYLGRGHTGTDAFVYFPARRVIHTGDLVTATGVPFVDYKAGGSILEWTTTLDKSMTAMDWDTLIPGHGPISPKQMMLTYKTNFEAMREKMRAGVRASQTEAEMTAFLLREYKWGPASLQILAGDVPGFMRELK